MKIGLGILFSLSLGLVFSEIHGDESEEPKCKEGNFSLNASQQPGPLIAFGQYIIPKHQLQLILFGDAYIGQKQHFTDLVPRVLYGITDKFSVLYSVPFAPTNQVSGYRSSGIEDVFVQFEYAIYNRDKQCSSDQITIVANVAFPTGSSHKNPPTGFGAMSYFIGTTYNHAWVNWWLFTSFGAELPTAHHGTRFGNQYLYEAGVGRNIFFKKGWIFAWLVEADGIFYERNKIHGEIDHDSGGNVIYLVPSLWASSLDWVFQFGAGYAVQQNLFGSQNREEYLFSFNIQRSF